MDKKQKYLLLLFCCLSLCMMVGIGKYMERAACAKNVCDWWSEYTYYDRNLSVNDFAEFGYDMTYEEIIEQLGMPNGWRRTNSLCLPYYELNDGRFAVCGCYSPKYIYIANDKDVEYYLLPMRLKQKSETIKKREVENARQSEMNIVLWMLGMKDLKQCLDNRKPFFEVQNDEPLGEFSAEKLKQYTDREITMETSYYFGAYRASDLFPLIQLVWLYEEQKPVCFGYVLWDTDMLGCLMKDNADYVEDEDDWVLKAEKYELKGRKELFDIDSKGADLTSINLSPDKISNSLTEFLVKQKVIRNIRNTCVEFWGEDGNGNYVCVLMTSLWKKGRGIHADSKDTQYYFITMGTLDNRAVSVNVMCLDRDI